VAERRTRTESGGFTLIEVIAVIVLLGIVAGVTLPLAGAAADRYAGAERVRTDAEHAAMAVDRIARLIREIPADADGVEVAALTPGRLETEAGALVERLGSTLWLTIPGEEASPLCQEVAAFALRYFGRDGLELDPGAGDAPADTHAIEVSLTRGRETLITRVFLRGALAR